MGYADGDYDVYFEIERERAEADWPADTVFTVKCPAGHSYRTSTSIDGLCDTCEYEGYQEAQAWEDAHEEAQEAYWEERFLPVSAPPPANDDCPF